MVDPRTYRRDRHLLATGDIYRAVILEEVEEDRAPVGLRELKDEGEEPPVDFHAFDHRRWVARVDLWPSHRVFPPHSSPFLAMLLAGEVPEDCPQPSRRGSAASWWPLEDLKPSLLENVLGPGFVTHEAQGEPPHSSGVLGEDMGNVHRLGLVHDNQLT